MLTFLNLVRLQILNRFSRLPSVTFRLNRHFLAFLGGCDQHARSWVRLAFFNHSGRITDKSLRLLADCTGSFLLDPSHVDRCDISLLRI